MDVLMTVASLISCVAALGAVWYARDTVKITREARADEVRRRGRDSVRELQGLVAEIKTAARVVSSDPHAPWRCSAQEALARALQFGPDVPLPECWALYNESRQDQVAKRADAADAELSVALMVLAGYDLGPAGEKWVDDDGSPVVAFEPDSGDELEKMLKKIKAGDVPAVVVYARCRWRLGRYTRVEQVGHGHPPARGWHARA